MWCANLLIIYCNLECANNETWLIDQFFESDTVTDMSPLDFLGKRLIDIWWLRLIDNWCSIYTGARKCQHSHEFLFSPIRSQLSQVLDFDQREEGVS